MNNNQYISMLKKALAGLDKVSRNDIIAEIKSHAADSGASLIERFGPADELAKQYLDGEIIAKPISSKVWGLSKSLVKIIGIGVVAIIAFFAISAYFFTKDKFDYSDENASELTEGSWQTLEWSSDLQLNTDQASVIIYWHDENNIRWKCDGSGLQKQAESNIMIRQSHCYLYLPKVAISLNVEQSQVVLIKPQTSLTVNARQASIKIAEKGEKYKYETDTNLTKISHLQSTEDAKYILRFKTKESMVSKYKY